MQIAVLLGMLLIMFMLGVAIPYSLALSTVLFMILSPDVNLSLNIIPQKMIAGTTNFTLLAIPFFLLAGKLMNCGSITERIFKLCNALVGWIPGGLAHANVLASIVFAGMSGSAVADAAGLGTIEIKAMSEEGFDVDFSAAVTAASSTIGPIIPPSIPLIIYGVTVGASIASLLIAGIIPGLIMGITLSVMVFNISKKRNYPCRKFPTIKEIWDLTKYAFLALLTPVILIGGILGGIFTATEASAIATLYALILVTLVYREVTMNELYTVLCEVARESTAIMLVVGAATLFGFLTSRLQIPQKTAELLLEISSSKTVFLVLVNILLLVVGCFMETNATILILGPILLPVATQFGIHPVHFGIIMVLNLMIGLLTPPVGMCLYATASVAKISFERMVKAVAPFYIPLLVTLTLVTFVPGLVMWLPNLLK